ncbi:MAG: hypothetical protein GVY31_09630 [Alphaproteobacteria bacterium]|jgi:hypothetical protein|nr:hypothetical protein [Alphaproteobacteria bacterium]
MAQRRGLRSQRPLAALAIGFALMPGTLPAQDGDRTESYRIVESVDAPLGDASQGYRDLAARYRVSTDPVYAMQIEGNLSSGRQARDRNALSPRPLRDAPALDLGGMGVFLVILVLVAALFLWLKFGGSGALLRREPDDEQVARAPADWDMGADHDAGDPRGLLDRIAAMEDRSAALVLLLRHCLLAAAGQTETRFARSDTERLAFRRLPRSWQSHDLLGALLRKTELVHYGGRPVTESDFQGSLEIGRRILGPDAGGKRNVG